MPDANGVYVPVPQCADAQIDTTLGALICNTTYASTLDPATKGIYHNYDFPFFFQPQAECG